MFWFVSGFANIYAFIKLVAVFVSPFSNDLNLSHKHLEAYSRNDAIFPMIWINNSFTRKKIKTNFKLPVIDIVTIDWTERFFRIEWWAIVLRKLEQWPNHYIFCVAINTQNEAEFQISKDFCDYCFDSQERVGLFFLLLSIFFVIVRCFVVNSGI